MDHNQVNAYEYYSSGTDPKIWESKTFWRLFGSNFMLMGGVVGGLVVVGHMALNTWMHTKAEMEGLEPVPAKKLVFTKRNRKMYALLLALVVAAAAGEALEGYWKDVARLKYGANNK